MRTQQTPPAADQAESTRLRLTFLTMLVVSLFVVLFARLWFLQVMAGDRYANLAQGNAIRTIALDPPRGKILDRDGEQLVTNRYANVVGVTVNEMGERKDEVLADLADLLGIDRAELDKRISRSRVGPFEPTPIAIDVSDDIVFYIHENAATRYPGVYADQQPLRDYPDGALAAHVVGYVGEVSAAQLETDEFADYGPGDLIGWAGVERTYEENLRGREGRRVLEVNANNEAIRQVSETLPQAGADVVLSIDADLQAATENALQKGIETARTVRDREAGENRAPTFVAPAGSSVVMDVDTGEIISLASFPTFEPSRFVGGVSSDYWEWLQSADNDYPLINRAIQSSYPPGSVFKVVSAAAALESGFISQTDRLPCPSRWEWNGQIFRNWSSRDNPAMNMVEALTASCDTVFYELAREMWTREQETGATQEFVPDEAQQWGLGQTTGIDLPGERTGVVPGRAWKQQYWESHRDTYCADALRYPEGSYPQRLFSELCGDSGRRWRGGDAVNMSIGQGDVQTTPLQIASIFGAIATRGVRYQPRVVTEIRQRDGSVQQVEPQVAGTLPASAELLGYIEQGLLGVTATGGTAGSVFGDFPVPIAGKTGTAELKPKQPFAWFAAYNPQPVDGRRYVVVTVVEQGGGGSQTAAPIVRRIFEALLGQTETEIQPGVATD